MDILTVRLWIQKTSRKGSSLPSYGRAHVLFMVCLLPILRVKGCQRRHRQHDTVRDSRRHSSVPSLWARRWSDRTFPSWPNAPGQASKRLETLETPGQRAKGPKGKQLTRSRYFQVLYSLSWHAAKTSVVCWRCGKPFWRQEVNRLGDKWCDKREDRRR